MKEFIKKKIGSTALPCHTCALFALYAVRKIWTGFSKSKPQKLNFLVQICRGGWIMKEFIKKFGFTDLPCHTCALFALHVMRKIWTNFQKVSHKN